MRAPAQRRAVLKRLGIRGPYCNGISGLPTRAHMQRLICWSRAAVPSGPSHNSVTRAERDLFVCRVFAVGWPTVKKVATRRLAKNRSTALCKLIQVGETDSATLGSGKTAPKPTLKQPTNRSFIMLQASEIQKRFTHLEQTIGKASQACHADTTLPKDLMDCVNQLDKQSETATKIAESKDENRIRQWVDDLEQVGGRPENACQGAANVRAKVETTVTAVHAELSDLKKQLH